MIQKRFLPASDKGNRWLPATSVLYLSCPAQWGGLDCGSQENQVRGTGLLHYISYQTCKLEFEFCFEFCSLSHGATGNSGFLDLWFQPTLSCEDAARLLSTLSTVWIRRSLWGANGPFWLFSAPWSQSEHLSCVGGEKVRMWNDSLNFQNLFLWKKLFWDKKWWPYQTWFHTLNWKVYLVGICLVLYPSARGWLVLPYLTRRGDSPSSEKTGSCSDVAIMKAITIY